MAGPPHLVPISVTFILQTFQKARPFAKIDNFFDIEKGLAYWSICDNKRLVLFVSGGSSTKTKVKTENASSSFEFGATSGSLLSPNLDEDLRLEDILKEEELELELLPEEILFKVEEIVESYKKAIFQCSDGKSSQVLFSGHSNNT